MLYKLIVCFAKAYCFWLEEFNWHWSVATPPLEPQAPGRIEEKNGCWLDGIEWKVVVVKYIHMT